MWRTHAKMGWLFIRSCKGTQLDALFVLNIYFFIKKKVIVLKKMMAIELLMLSAFLFYIIMWNLYVFTLL